MGLEQISSKCRKPAPSCILRPTFLQVVFVAASFLGSSGRHQVSPRVVKSRQTSKLPTNRAPALQTRDSDAACRGTLKGTVTGEGTCLGRCLGWDLGWNWMELAAP